MAARSKKVQAPRVADEIMTGMRALERMMDERKTPERMFAVKTIKCNPGRRLKLRARRVNAPKA
jgi:hypothetical protein